MRKSVGCFCMVCGAVGILAIHARAQVPEFKVVVTEVYEQVGPATWNAKCGVNCPTQNLPVGVAEPGDFLHVVVTVSGWDAEPDRGICDNPGYECSVSLQDCTQKHCQRSGSWCRFDSDCQGTDRCVPDVCHPWPRVGTYQWIVDSSGYWNGGIEPGLVPGTVSCVDDEHCWCYYDSACFTGAEYGQCTCGAAVCDAGTCSPEAAVYIDESHPDFIFLTTADLPAIDYATLDYAVGAIILTQTGVVEDPGTEYYLGTLLLEATANACGTFTVNLLQNTDPVSGALDTWLNNDTGARLPIPDVISLTINFPDIDCVDDCTRPADECWVDWCNPCTGECEFVYDDGAACEDGNPCTENDTCLDGACEPGRWKVCDPGYICDPADGLCKPECRWADLTEAYPPDCGIDARQPYALDNATEPYGWTELVLMFDCNPEVLNAQAEDFGLFVEPPIGFWPLIDSVVTDGAGHTITVTLDRQIAPSKWTCITHEDSGNQWCMGYLPGDVDQRNRSEPADIDALIGFINGAGSLPDYATDINRSNATNAQDILRLIDLLNGAGEFDPWISARLDPCPAH